MLQALWGIGKSRGLPGKRKGPPNVPSGPRVSATRHGVTGTNCSPPMAFWLNVAPTVRLPFIVTVQEFPRVVSQPVQPKNIEPCAAVAVSVTGVPGLYSAEHTRPQLMEPSALVTVPLPVFETERLKVGWLKVATTDCAWVMVTVHVPIPLHAPLHPLNTHPGA